ncbi:HET-domain-containing protein [Lophiostoma macrostomum CBS 122681]|uniref:HET-domain-containing protein n=1 Tax=Lophiostoma macrostomum CBS 122681 TaxID=1314788 RepID=A0A6A6SXP6_9PLEO|nr:HET-domain-containing protein [Lophiostoma macrostomum CBS 122681]
MQCVVCADVFDCRYTLGEAATWQERMKGYSDVSPYAQFHMSFGSFKLAVEGNCPLCNMLWAELKMGEYDASNEPFSMAFAIRSEPLDYLAALKFVIVRDARVTQKTATLRITTLSEKSFQKTETGELFRVEDTALALLGMDGMRGKSLENEEIGLRHRVMNLKLSKEDLFPIESNSGSDRTLKLARAWLHECCANHAYCDMHMSGTQSQRLPKRVMTLGVNGAGVKTVQLHQAKNDDNASYATLTHRWGSLKPMELVEANEASLKVGIELSLLPKTFQDAMLVADALGIKYVWIDSLCIQQDSADDWREQSRLMGNIYRYATVNIAATAAEDSSVGMFRDRDPVAITPVQVSLSWETVPWVLNRAGTTQCLLYPSSLWDEQVERSPLATRGWIFQERLLSTRVLHFTRNQVFWECPCSNACEIFPSGRPFFGVSGRTTSFQRLLYELPTESPSQCAADHNTVQQVSLAETYRKWAQLVEAYSNCQFTKPTDKLVALEGVASEMAQRLRGFDVYWLGHWRRYLPWELLWVAATRSSEDSRSATLFNATRSKRHPIAPTWSWASLDGGIIPFDLRLANVGNAQEAPPAFDPNSPNTLLPIIDSLEPPWWEGHRLHQTALLITVTDVVTTEQHGSPGAMSNQSTLLEFSTLNKSQSEYQGVLSAAHRPDENSYLELNGVILDAKLNPLRRQGAETMECWGAVFGYAGDHHALPSDHKFATLLALDDFEYFKEALLPYVKEENYPNRLVVLPIAWIDGGLEGLLLQELSDKVTSPGVDASSLNPDVRNSAVACFERVGKIEGKNVAARDGAWGDVSTINSGKKTTIRIY